MFSRTTNPPPSYPDVPDTLRSNSFEMTNMKKVLEARATTAPYVTPYLSLRSRLSQVWINRWTVLLLLVLVRVLLLVGQLNTNIGDANVRAVAACTEVENVGSAMASMPHYLSAGVNDMAATGIEQSVSAMVSVLDLMLSGVESIIIFFINFVVGTYVCLITAMIHGSLDVVGSVAEDATDAFNSIISRVTEEIGDIAGSLEGGISDLTEAIEDSIIGTILPDIPSVDFSGPIEELSNFELDVDSFVRDVRQLNEDLPDFAEVQNLTEEAIAIPFNFVREALRDAYSEYQFSRDVFPLAQREQLTFCSDNDSINNFFDGLYGMVETARVAFIAVLVILAVLVMGPMAWLEIQRWRREQSHARLVSQSQYDPMDVVYIASRPLTSSWGIWIASRFSGKKQVLVRWCFAYATTAPALFVLSLAMAGFFSSLCQVILLRAVQDQVPALATQVGAFADGVVSSLQEVSDGWASEANSVILDLNNDINQDVLGYVTNATDAVNDTLTVFLETMDEGLETVFNGTILLDSIRVVLHCVIGTKIENLQEGLTWVHDHSQITLPLFPNDTFSMGAEESISGDSELNTFLASPSSVTTDEVTGAVERVATWLYNSIIQEVLITTGIFLVYIIVVLIGVTRACVSMAMPDRTRAEGGAMHYTGDDGRPVSPRMAQGASPAFPRFGSEGVEDERSPTRDGEVRDDKLASGSYANQATRVVGHERSSSYGHLGIASKY
ncbi:hypothetical protein S40285_02910 [Stachybotrys chlorohalonatus IBT 40285]|uniref:Plasma membrane fusion protein PRM1 n=1 Tax=Stachybotrys chlorohalonatus (strain IBT 40285) TaxID=1283841 RepID=A0A084QK75_STAC4|nr:hypothetical protein S40285_02910 [Stachybotrys chlorohalonata IBT 40285]